MPGFVLFDNDSFQHALRYCCFPSSSSSPFRNAKKNEFGHEAYTLQQYNHIKRSLTFSAWVGQLRRMTVNAIVTS